MKKILLAIGLSLTTVLTTTASPEHVYQNGLRITVQFGSDLYEVLEPQFQKQIDPQPVCIAPLDNPVINPVGAQPGRDEPGQIFISAGFVDLLNHLAHAKAIDDIQPGFFRSYVSALANAAQSEPPKIEDSRFWTPGVMTAQESYFNQMIGGIMAINLTHDYLGHVRKYAGEMSAAKQTPINDLLTPAEWDASVKTGMRNALGLAVGTAGLRALFEAISTMPERPAWAIYIAPKQANLKKINQELTSLEEEFFHGRLKD